MSTLYRCTIILMSTSWRRNLAILSDCKSCSIKAAALWVTCLRRHLSPAPVTNSQWAARSSFQRTDINMHRHQLRKASTEWHHLEGTSVSHMGLADTKVCECNQGVEDHFFFQCTRYTKIHGSSCCSLCKKSWTDAGCKTVKDWSVTLLLATWASSVQNKVKTFCSQRSTISDKQDVRL